jgi:hypothetical protein
MTIETRVVRLDIAKNVFQVHSVIVAVKRSCGDGSGDPKLPVLPATNSVFDRATSGVCVNAIVPGVFRTEMNAPLLDGTERGREFLLRTPMRRFGRVDELAGAAVFLASDAASFRDICSWWTEAFSRVA